MLAIAGVLFIGIALLAGAIALRRQSAVIAATIALLLAAIWNAAIVFAFMSPRNRHVFHLSTHRDSVVFNAIVGIAWLVLCVLAVTKMWRATLEA